LGFLDPRQSRLYNRSVRYSQIFIQEALPNDETVRDLSHRLLLQGGYIRPLGNGLFGYLPMGFKVLGNIIKIIRKELQCLEGQEIYLPLVNDHETWKTSGRDKLVSSELIQFKDSKENLHVLAPSHEEACVDMLRQSLQHAEQLPIFLYQFQTKFRDEIDTSEGLLQAREFVMNDSFSFHRNSEELNNFIPRIFQTMHSIFSKMGLSVKVAEGAANYLAGSRTYDFLVESKAGTSKLVQCKDCDYIANQDVAVGLSPRISEKLRDLKESTSADAKNIEELQKKLGLPKRRSSITSLYRTSNGYALTVIRGDHQLSADKLSIVLKEPVLKKLMKNEIAELGLKPYSLSAFNFPESKKEQLQIRIVVDHSVADTANLLIGSNQVQTFYINANFGRDFEADLVGDIVRVSEQHRCYHCGGKLEVTKAIKLGSITKINDYYSQRFNFRLPNLRGEEIYPYMGSYGIGLGRLMYATVGRLAHKRGLLWPMSIAPYKAVLVLVGMSATIHSIANRVYEYLKDSILYDDRKIAITDKFKNINRLGIPIRIVISGETLEDGKAMVCHRTLCPPTRIPLGQIPHKVKELEELEMEVKLDHEY
jgi:prolyl-tRNA synthetase